jgi:EAL domain-containing protein (putative c-di-GMP-specific phosphodiesterase class I)
MLELAHSINLRVVAEGVEREEQWDALSEMGCDLVQGYLIARPQGPERMNKLMEKGHLTDSVPLATRETS